MVLWRGAGKGKGENKGLLVGEKGEKAREDVCAGEEREGGRVDLRIDVRYLGTGNRAEGGTDLCSGK